MWKKYLKQWFDKNRYATAAPGASSTDIGHVESALGIKLPPDLVAFLSESNGDNEYIFSAEKIITENQELRNEEYYMPLDNLLFFAGNGCGDYYGYAVRKDGDIGDIFLWDHELDSRTWVAANMEMFLMKLVSDML